MEAIAQSLPDPAPDRAKPLLRTLVLCDLVDSTALVHQLGDLAATHLIRRHDRFARALLQVHDGHEIDKTDGFLLMFDRPIQAVAFALDYQRNLHQFNLQEGSQLKARVGIHVGDVLLWDNDEEEIAKGAKPIDIEGLAKPITSRLASLARPGQILLSGITWVLAHRAQGELTESVDKIRWRAHGRFRFKGVPEPVPVFEVGEEGLAPFRTPPWSGKAHREVPFWRRPSVLVFEALLIAAAIIVPVYMMLRSPPAIAFASRDWVVVGDFQNHTDQSVFDDSLQVAFRIGLEQSRYVNILSDLKVRDTVARMKRDPNATPIDRTIGSEVALRDGARALILPSIAEIGGRVRVTAEVVDPKTQTTVYSESADGLGADSVLPSVDKVNRQLRERLGEAVAVISTDTKPLEKATTSNLDALRAYSLGVSEYVKGSPKEAIPLYRQALALDPDFSLARLALGDALVFSSAGDNTEAIAEFKKAASQIDRLSARDALFAEAWLSNFQAPRAALDKWRLLHRLYPDFSKAAGSLGFFAYAYANHFDEAIRAIEQIAVSTNPRRANGDYLLATLYLGTERFEESARRFAEAESNGFVSANLYYAYLYFAQRKYEEGQRVLARGRGGGVPSADSQVWMAFVTQALDRGLWTQAVDLIGQARKATAGSRGSLPRDFETVELMLRSLSEPAGTFKPALERYVRERRADTQADPPDNQFYLLLAAYLAAQGGDQKLARSALEGLTPVTRNGDYPYLTSLLNLVEAELARVDGRPEDAVEQIKLTLDGSEFYLSHRVLMHAYADLGNDAAALAEAQWLIRHRGRAFAEQFGQGFLMPINVTLSNIALLDAAQYQIDLGKAAEARASIATLRQVWKGLDAIPQIGGRARALADKAEP